MRYFVSFLLLFLAIQSNAQYNLDYVENLKIVGDTYPIKKPEPVIGVIIYQQTYKYDSTDLTKIRIDTMALSYSENSSDYRLESMRLLDSLVTIQIKSLEKKDPKEKSTYNYPKGASSHFSKERFLGEGNTIYKCEDLYGLHYLLEYRKEKLNWNIEDSVKQILGYSCQKATCNAFGRNYTAWFTTDLPNAFGPRTLNGLPGTILEAYDVSNQIHYFAINLFSKRDPENVIGLPDKGIPCTKKEFDAMMEVVDKDPTPFLRGQKGIAVGRTNIANGSFKYKKSKKAPKNAIELEMD